MVLDRTALQPASPHLSISASQHPTLSLNTLIKQHLAGTGQPVPPADACALVPMGGGARTAYQAGVLKARSAMPSTQPVPPG